MKSFKFILFLVFEKICGGGGGGVENPPPPPPPPPLRMQG